ncbi:hypothetical protein MY3296_008328 [Beauveria thailandica]
MDLISFDDVVYKNIKDMNKYGDTSVDKFKFCVREACFYSNMIMSIDK